MGWWGQCREDAEFETLGDKVDVFQGSLGMRRMFSKGVWGQEGCWAKFCPGFKPFKVDWGCTTSSKIKMTVFQSLLCFMLIGEHQAAVGPQMQHSALPSEMENSGSVGKSKATL